MELAIIHKDQLMTNPEKMLRFGTSTKACRETISMLDEEKGEK